MCMGLHGTHRRAKCAYREHFEEEYDQLKMEYGRLCELFRDVCWYEHERRSMSWAHPWYGHVKDLHLHGYRIESVWRRGHRHDFWRFPLYYEGHPSDAPPLPVNIVANELATMLTELEVARANCTAAQDWAPGGCKYELLLKGSTATAMQSSKQQVNDKYGPADEDESMRE